MRRRELLTAPAVVAIATAGPVATPPPVIARYAALDAMLRPYLAQFGLPALAGRLYAMAGSSQRERSAHAASAPAFR